jgi:carbamoyltransferase
MYIIGISAFYHNSSVSLFKNDKLIFAVEEERFTGIKNDSSFPYKSLEYIVENFNLSDENVEAVCFYETPKLKFYRIIDNFLKNPIKSLKITISSLIKLNKDVKTLKREASKFSDILYYETHHNSHLYYSYYTSPFDDAIVVSVDGVGETDSMVYGVFKNGKMETKSILKYPHSLGLFYSAMTSFLGFKPNEGEYKLMGLAGFGDSELYYSRVRDLLSGSFSDIKNDMSYFNWNISDKSMFTERLGCVFGFPNRLPEEGICIHHKDLAASVQRVYEEVLFDTLNILYEKEGLDNLCLGGGCAYNGVANGKITTHTPYKDVWIPPAPSDAGSSVGAVLGYIHNNRKVVNKVNETPFLGPEYSDSYIETMKVPNLTKYTDEELINFLIKELSVGKIVGICRGKSEFGARALGNRSIIANPFITGMRDKMNHVIKKREGFRPFAPMVAYEKQFDYFDKNDYIPYMNQVVSVRDYYKSYLIEVSNVDGSSRVQSVSVDLNKFMYNLLNSFSEKTGHAPILLNTSFNVMNQTMVLTPEMAYDTFLTTDIDILVLNNYVIYK